MPPQPRSDEVVHIPWTKIVIDLCLMMCVALPVLFINVWGTPFHRGFFCDDETIRYPYATSTVPSEYLYLLGLVMPCIVMILVEYLYCPRKNLQTPKLIRGVRIPFWVENLYCVMGVFLFGMGCCQLTTDIFKCIVGRLRPHFYDVCWPSVNCTEDMLAMRHTYFTNYSCTNPKYPEDSYVIQDVRLSFPSGHSSFSLYSMTYFSIYLHQRITWKGSILLRRTLAYVGILTALLIAVSRVCDNKHHWTDVFAGSILGFVIACASAFWYISLSRHKLKNPLVEKTDDNNALKVQIQPPLPSPVDISTPTRNNIVNQPQIKKVNPVLRSNI